MRDPFEREAPTADLTPPPPLGSGEKAWKTPHRGPCAACGARGLLLRHHVVYRQHIRKLHGDQWDLRDAMSLGVWACGCHEKHHSGAKRLRLRQLPTAAIEFAAELMGPAAAYEYLTRRYTGVDSRVARLVQ